MQDNHQGHLDELLQTYLVIRPDIEERLSQFRQKWESGTDEEIFIELAFCLFTPQSKARSCWATVEDLLEKEILWTGTASELSERMNRVRFRNNKARYLVQARETFENGRILHTKVKGYDTSQKRREFLVENVNGLGMKESSHFLRNIGRGSDLAILDRHILKNLVLLGVIEELPASMTRQTYLTIENKMQNFSISQNIPMDHLDLLLWYKEAGEIFK